MFGDRERKTTTIDQLIDFTDANNPIVLFGTKKADTVTVKGQIIDISDKDNPKVLFGDKDAELRTIKGQNYKQSQIRTSPWLYLVIGNVNYDL